jgi:hypothetical protein
MPLPVPGLIQISLVVREYARGDPKSSTSRPKIAEQKIVDSASNVSLEAVRLAALLIVRASVTDLSGARNSVVALKADKIVQLRWFTEGL